MKTRNGFVSNSSSSSFIIATKGSTKLEINVEIDLSDFGEVVETIEELDKYLIEDCGHSTIEDILNDEYLREDYYKAKKAIEAGKKVVYGNFASDSGDALESYLCERGLIGLVSENEVEIIQGEGGY